MKQIVVSLLFILLFTACDKYKYPQDKKISDKGGAIIDTLGGHLPKEFVYDGKTQNLAWNSNLIMQINSYYLETKEPVLFNYYLDRDVFRLLLHEEGKEPLILSLNKEERRAWIVSKRISIESPEVTDQQELDSIADLPLLWVNFDVKSRELNKQQVQTFDSLFQTINFFDLPVGEVDKKYDNYCVFEAHQKNKYWYVYRSSDDTSLADISEYIRSLSGY